MQDRSGAEATERRATTGRETDFDEGEPGGEPIIQPIFKLHFI